MTTTRRQPAARHASISAVEPPTLTRYVTGESSRPADVAAPRCTTASHPATAGARLAASARSPPTMSNGPGGGGGAVRESRGNVWPARASAGASAAPMNPDAPVTSTRLAMAMPPGPALLTQLIELLFGEARPAIAGVRADHEPELVAGSPPVGELPLAEPDVVVALRDPDGAGKIVDHALVAGHRVGGPIRAEQARGAEERGVPGRVGLTAEEPRPVEVVDRGRVVALRERVPPALVEARRPEIAREVPRRREREQDDRRGHHHRAHDGERRVDAIACRGARDPTRCGEAEDYAGKRREDPEPVDRDVAIREPHVRAGRED